MHVGLAHLHRDALAERGAEGHLVEQAAVDAGDRHRSALAHGLDGLRRTLGRSVSSIRAVFTLS